MPQRRAYFYGRCSTDEQKSGRSIPRQREAAQAYCQRHGLVLNDREFLDIGVSAFTLANVTHGQLGEFIGLVKEGRIAKGSVLVVEHLDRISRSMEQEKAAQAIMPVIRAGIDVATTSPEVVYTKANIDRLDVWLPLAVQQALAAEESRKKSVRIKDDRQAKRAAARDGRTPFGKAHPVWLRLVGQEKDSRGRVVKAGRFEIDDEKAALVRRMFEMAAEGYGVGRIARILNVECPAGMTGKGWRPSYIRTVLRNRAVLGEHQPHTGVSSRKGKKSTREKSGEPIPNFYPTVISEADFYRVQEALDGRRHGGGRVTGVPNLFNGLAYDAFDQQRMVVNMAHRRRFLVSGGAMKRRPGSVFRGINYEVFERAILGRLEELKPEDVTGKPNGAQDRVAEVSGRLTVVNRKLDEANARAAAEDDQTVYLDLIAALSRQRKQLIADLEKAHAEVASRPADNLGELKSLIRLLDEADPEGRTALRQKVQAGLRRVVQSIWVAVVVGPGRMRVARILILFKGEGKELRPRHYVIGQKWPMNGGSGGWFVDSWPEVMDPRWFEETAEAQAEELWDIGTFYHGEGGPWTGPDDEGWWAETFDRPLNPIPE
jgi:DNA invertase Pin-like site-specific DNA recombinase